MLLIRDITHVPYVAYLHFREMLRIEGLDQLLLWVSLEMVMPLSSSCLSMPSNTTHRYKVIEMHIVLRSTCFSLLEKSTVREGIIIHVDVSKVAGKEVLTPFTVLFRGSHKLNQKVAVTFISRPSSKTKIVLDYILEL